MNRQKESKKFQKRIDKQASWLKRWRKKGISWEKVIIVGAIGWMIILPMVLGGYLGNYLDREYKIANETLSWTITFIVLGLFVGIYSVWKLFFYNKR